MRVLLPLALLAGNAAATEVATGVAPGLGQAMGFFTKMGREAENEHEAQEKALKELKCKCATDKADTEDRIKTLTAEVSNGEKALATKNANLVKFTAKRDAAKRAAKSDLPEANFTEEDLKAKQQEAAECTEGQKKPLFTAKTSLEAKMEGGPNVGPLAPAHQIVSNLHDQVAETCSGLEQEAEKIQNYLIQFNDEVASFTERSANTITSLSEQVLNLKTEAKDLRDELESDQEELEGAKKQKVDQDQECEESLQLSAEQVLKLAQKKEGLGAIVAIFKGKPAKKAFLQKP